MLAALLLYRLIYTLLPFAIAALGLGLNETIHARRGIERVARWTHAAARPAVPPVAAGIAPVSGIVLLFSGNLPGETSRLAVLREVVPLPLIELSHLVGSIAGLLLVVVARGLYRKLRRAWAAAMILLGLGLLASLARGLDWEEASLLLVGMGLLWLFRDAFYRVAGAVAFRLSAPWARCSPWPGPSSGSVSLPIRMSPIATRSGGSSRWTAMRRAFCGPLWWLPSFWWSLGSILLSWRAGVVSGPSRSRRRCAICSQPAGKPSPRSRSAATSRFLSRRMGAPSWPMPIQARATS